MRCFSFKKNREKREYNLMRILLSNYFFENISKAAEISYMYNKEASFSVNGDIKKYFINSVLEEDENVCRAGIDKFGIVYDKKWCGLYMPENKFKIVDIHFHTPESVAIPSLQDIKSLYIMLARNSVKNYEKFTGGIGCVNPLDIIGHKRKSGITLFILQFTDKFEYNITDEKQSYVIDEIIESMYKEVEEKIGDFYHWLDFSNKDLPFKFADCLSSRGFFRASVINFVNKDEYKRKIAKEGKIAFFRLRTIN